MITVNFVKNNICLGVLGDDFLNSVSFCGKPWLIHYFLRFFSFSFLDSMMNEMSFLVFDMVFAEWIKYCIKSEKSLDYLFMWVEICISYDNPVGDRIKILCVYRPENFQKLKAQTSKFLNFKWIILKKLTFIVFFHLYSKLKMVFHCQVSSQRFFHMIALIFNARIVDEKILWILNDLRLVTWGYFFTFSWTFIIENGLMEGIVWKRNLCGMLF